MKLADRHDIPSIQETFDQSIRFAREVSFTDWPYPYPEELLVEYIESSKLYCFESDLGIDAALVLSEVADERIWQERDNDTYLYIGKLATADHVRGTRFTSRVVIPEVCELASKLGKRGLRLDCLAATPLLGQYYDSIGFTDMGDVTIFSRTNQHTIDLQRKQMNLA